MIGVNLQLFDGATAKASLTSIQALWWDITEPKNNSFPVGKSDVVITDSNGYINLDLSGVSALSIGDYGFLMLYKLDGTDHKDSLVFAGKVQTSNIGSGVALSASDKPWIVGKSVVLSIPSAPTPVASTAVATYTDAGAVTMSIASPCVVTKATHGYSDGREIFFKTTGALPTGIVQYTHYFVKSTGTDTFNIAATVGGTNINTSGSQSGTHNIWTKD